MSADAAVGSGTSGARSPVQGEPPLDLSRATLIGHGWKRDCYLHPDDPGRCIKVPSIKPKGTRRFRERFIEWRTGGSVGDQHNGREWAAYRRYEGLLAPYLPVYHGFVATTRGRGLLIDVVRDADGRPSAHLKDWLRSAPEETAAPLLAQLSELLDLLLYHEIWLMDLNLTNFVAQIGPDGTARPKLIDIKRIADNKELFQISGWSRTLMRRKLARRIARFHAKVEMTRNG